MSSGVLRSCRRPKRHASRSLPLTCAGPMSPAQTDDASPSSEPPGAMRIPSCLGSSIAIVPNARSRTVRRRANRPSARSERRSDRERARNSHTSFAPARSRIRVRQEHRTQRPSLASFDARAVRRAPSAHERHVSSTSAVHDFCFQRRIPTSCIAIRPRSPVKATRSKKASVHDEAPASVRRWGSDRVLAERIVIDGSSDIPSPLGDRWLRPAPASQGRFRRATRDGSSSSFATRDIFCRGPTVILLSPSSGHPKRS
jgi:hypothetical protein